MSLADPDDLTGLAEYNACYGSPGLGRHRTLGGSDRWE